jgi:hypothetical protein
MKLLLLLALCAAVSLAAVVKMPIHKKVTDGKTLKLRRAANKPMPSKYNARLKQGSQNSSTT